MKKLEILPAPAQPPLTVADALRNIAAEALERRRARGISDTRIDPGESLLLDSAQHDPDGLIGGSILDPFDEPQQHRPQVRARSQQEALLV